jgi:membrane protein DedA with SNARE-associated domain
MEQIVENIISMNPLWIYLAAALIAYVENIFPPFPSDVVIVAAGYLCAAGRIDFWAVLILATIGSTTGFISMYKVGSWFGLRIIETGKFKFIKLDRIHKVEKWFNKYGYFIVVANRFLAGTRAVISFFTGMSNLSLWRTAVLAAVSSLVWNLILLYGGRALGSNWPVIVSYLKDYGRVVTVVTVLLILFFIGRNFLKKRRKGDLPDQSRPV